MELSNNELLKINHLFSNAVGHAFSQDEFQYETRARLAEDNKSVVYTIIFTKKTQE